MKQQAGLDDLDLAAIAESQALRAQGFRPKPISNKSCDSFEQKWARVMKCLSEMGDEKCPIP